MSDDNGLYPRQVAYDILGQVLGQKNPLDQTLARHKNFNTLESRDRNLTRMIVATILRRKLQMDKLIELAQDKPQQLRPSNIYYFLYIGIAQLLFMDVPDHAAVDVTVRLAEAEKMERQKGLINAILRRIGREGKENLSKMDMVQTTIPQWLLELWIKDYGLSEAAKIAEYSLHEAPTDISLKENNPLWAEKLEGKFLPTGSLRRQSGGSVIDLEGFHDGDWWVQDASAALPAKLFGNLKDEIVIDMCAAPGGKTSQLAAAGAKVIALDRSAKRMERLAENMIRLGFKLKVEIVIADGAMWQPSEPVDAVLLDAPCSATGTIRRHPDVMHLKSAQDIARLNDLQMKLLENAAKMIKPDGVLIYCTCSLQKSEGERQIDQFLANNPDLTRKAITPDEVGGLTELITKDGDVRVLPYHLKDQGGMDGFYVARLVKT